MAEFSVYVLDFASLSAWARQNEGQNQKDN